MIQEKFALFFVWSDNEEIRSVNEANGIIKRLLKSFLTNYQNEAKILRNGSNFVFESFDLLFYHIHKISSRSPHTENLLNGC